MNAKQALLDSLIKDPSNSQRDSKYLDTPYSAPYQNNNNNNDDDKQQQQQNNNNTSGNNNIILKRKNTTSSQTTTTTTTTTTNPSHDEDDNDDLNNRPLKRQTPSSFNNNNNNNNKTTNNNNNTTNNSNNNNNNNNDDEFDFSFEDDLEQQRNMLLNEELEDEQLSHIWQWKSDANNWVNYDIDFCKRLERHYARSKENFKVDKERFIDLKHSLQRRYDDPQKIRNVQRVKASSSSFSSSSTSSSTNKNTINNSNRNNNGTIKNNNNNVYPTTNTNTNSNTNRNFNPSKSSPPSSSSSSSSSTSSAAVAPATSIKKQPTETYDRNIPGEWYWQGPDGWERYDSEISTRLEKAYTKEKKRSEVDEDRYVEFEGRVQRRYDDQQKIRSIKRFAKDDHDNIDTTTLSTKPQTSTMTATPTPPPPSSSSNNYNIQSSPVKTNNTVSQSTPKSSNSSFNSNNYNTISDKSNKNNNNNNNNNNNANNNNDQDVKWKWLGDNGYMDYSASESELIESAFNNKQPTVEIAVGPACTKVIIDFKSYLQRRVDNPERKRQIKRFFTQATFNTTNQPLKPTKSIAAKIVKEPVFLDLNNEDDYEEEMKHQQQQQDDLDDDIAFNDPDYRKKKRQLYACGNSYLSEENILTWYDFVEEKREKFRNQANLFYPPNANLSKKISLFGGDITTLEIDGILNAAKQSLLGGGGIDGAIHKAAGPSLYRQCKTLGGCAIGQSKITKAFRLPADYIIHTVGPIDGNGDKLRSCYQTTLDTIVKHNIRTFAFCCVATGIYGFPNKEAASIVLDTIRSWLETNHSKVDRLIFCVFTNEDYVIYGKLLQLYFPVHPIGQ
ncbi:hypothetical protein DFA_09777 [Cavenderia fasciculata]|uniref:Uncharacterized protein n=1 Tax=Cavenderia fasciculata TaxID=261658 RepID=F4Q8K5_CACFS|nr:uncharacterized protein DFA_09777 [Cavenderia fasciculata]EGG16105.1 hypothetical protein DFA_09777 [Cavenderia fasciculata]|eukprot:XP_004352430.1 hypothetical protein DFA_09777 [Cavenderia fasciculata]